MSYLVGVDLGQAQDYTAIAVLEQRTAIERTDPRPATPAPPTLVARYDLRYLARPPLGTPYPAIVRQVLALLDRHPLTRAAPLVVDQTGVGRAVVDMFAAAGVRARAVTITGGDAVVATDPWTYRVPKRDLAGTLVALYQGKRLRVAAGLALGQTLADELLNFSIKINVATGHESYEAWRERAHDDLVLAVALAAWYGEAHAGRPSRLAAGAPHPAYRYEHR